MIHQYKSNGYNIIIDANSGSVHVVDDVAYDVIALYDKGESKEDITNKILEKYQGKEEITASDIDDVLSDIEELKKDGKLFSESNYQNLAIDFKGRDTVIKALCLHIAHDLLKIQAQEEISRLTSSAANLL